MFESLNEKLGKIFDGLRGKGRLSEDDVAAAMREIRVALLEADVALPVVKQFVEDVKARAVGQDLIKSVSPAQQVVKIVNDTLIETLGSAQAELKFASPPSVYLMAGLQGSGKTTSSAKLAVHLRDKLKKKVLMASLDTQRPAAQEQLKTLGEQTSTATLPIMTGQSVIDITKRALEAARLEGFDVLILDTAGRTTVDTALMDEVAAVADLAKPVETLLVADAMTGQDAVHTANAFNERLSLTGIILTRIDGDARGGAALSMKAVTGKPIKFLGTGEKTDALEAFHPDRIASRILGMGDVVSLVEKAVETIDQDNALEMAKKFKKGQFDFNDMLSQMQQMKKMGGMGSLMKMLPGLGKMASQIEDANLDDTIVKKQEAIILSMTKAEREKPGLLNASRKKRIAAGSGTSVQEINKLIKQMQQMQTMMKRMRKMGMGKMMGMMKGMMGGKDQALLEQGMADPDSLNELLGQSGGDANPLGHNPFLSGGGSGLPPGGLPGLPPGLGGFGGGSSKASARKGKKKRKK